MGLKAVAAPSLSALGALPVQTIAAPRLLLSQVLNYCTQNGVAAPACVLTAREAFSDSGRTAPAVDGGAVAALRDITGNGFHAVQATGANQPVFRAQGMSRLFPGLDFSGGSAKIMTTSGGAFTASGFSAGYTVYVTAASGAANPVFGSVQVLWQSVTGNHYISTKLTNQIAGSVNNNTIIFNSDVTDMTGVYVNSWDGITGTAGLNGQYKNQAIAGTVPTSGDFDIGNTPGGGLPFTTGVIGDIWLFPGKHSKAQMDGIGALLMADLGYARPGFLFVGDSISRGFGLASPTVQCWANQLMNMLGANSLNALYENVAIDGETLATMITDVVGTPYNRTGFVSSVRGSQNIVFIMAGTNSISAAGDNLDAATAFSQLQALCGLYRSSACKVVVGTCISRNPSGAGASFAARAASFNAMIYAAGSSLCDILFDFAGNANLGAVNAYTNTTWFQADGIHPSEQGATLMAQIAARALVNAYGVSPVLLSSQPPAKILPNILLGTTAGQVLYAMPVQGSFDKRLVATFSGYENNTAVNQTITFPVPFASAPVISGNTTGLTISVNATTLTVTAPANTTLFSGTVIVQGF